MQKNFRKNEDQMKDNYSKIPFRLVTYENYPLKILLTHSSTTDISPINFARTEFFQQKEELFLWEKTRPPNWATDCYRKQKNERTSGSWLSEALNPARKTLSLPQASFFAANLYRRRNRRGFSLSICVDVNSIGFVIS